MCAAGGGGLASLFYAVPLELTRRILDYSGHEQLGRLAPCCTAASAFLADEAAEASLAYAALTDREAARALEEAELLAPCGCFFVCSGACRSPSGE